LHVLGDAFFLKKQLGQEVLPRGINPFMGEWIELCQSGFASCMHLWPLDALCCLGISVVH
jgi:hypothetical protein